MSPYSRLSISGMISPQAADHWHHTCSLFTAAAWHPAKMLSNLQDDILRCKVLVQVSGQWRCVQACLWAQGIYCCVRPSGGPAPAEGVRGCLECSALSPHNYLFSITGVSGTLLQPACHPLQIWHSVSQRHRQESLAFISEIRDSMQDGHAALCRRMPSIMTRASWQRSWSP